MPIKKRSKSSGRKSAASPGNESTLIGAEDGVSTSAGLPPELRPKEKPKKKKKLTKAEKALVKLEKQCDTFRASGQPYTDLMKRMDRWITANYERAIILFKKVDDGEGYVTFEEFKAGMFDLMIPCSTLELHLLCQLLDTEQTEEINYMKLSEGLKHIREIELSHRHIDVRPALPESPRKHVKCARCQMPVWDGEPYKEKYPRFIEVLFRLVTFEGWKDHPGHFNKVVHSHVTGFGLLEVIREQTGILSQQMAIFTDKSRDVKCMLPLEKSLEELNFPGGSEEEPTELLLYYDYRVQFTDCPILQCDHYFGQKLKI